MLVAATQVPPELKDISQVEFEFQFPVAILLKYSWSLRELEDLVVTYLATTPNF